MRTATAKLATPAPAATTWRDVCALDEILPDSGVCALVGGRQVAIFRTTSGVHAIDNADPIGGANVLSRGIVGDIGGELVVASPLYKQHFNLATGRCLENPDVAVATHRVRVSGGRVLVEHKVVRAPIPLRKRRLVLVGNGMAGMRALEELLALAPNRYEITVFGAEPRGGYNRVLLSSVLGGDKTFDDIAGHDRAWYESRGITLHAGDPVARIDRVRRVVESAGGVRCEYDRLVLATGSVPVELDVPGSDLPGVVRFRTVDDVEEMLRVAGGGGHAVVIGGGMLGVEAASGLLQRGMTVTIVHRSDSLMNRQLDPEAGRLLRESLEQRGIACRTGTRALGFGTNGEGRVASVMLDDGSELRADLIVTALGIRPNIALAAAAELQCGRGILVDDTMQTFDPRVYAIGECVQHRRVTFGLVAPLWEQARVCATHLAELGVSRYRSPLAPAQLKVTGVNVFSAGDVRGGSGAESIVLKDPARGIYKRLVLRDNRMQGALLYGDVSDGAWYCEMMRDGRDVGSIREALLFGQAQASAGAR